MEGFPEISFNFKAAIFVTNTKDLNPILRLRRPEFILTGWTFENPFHSNIYYEYGRTTNFTLNIFRFIFYRPTVNILGLSIVLLVGIASRYY